MVPKAVSEGHTTSVWILGPSSASAASIPVSPVWAPGVSVAPVEGVGADEAGADGPALPEGPGEGAAEPGGDVGADGLAEGAGAGATHPALRGVEGKAAIDWRAFVCRPASPARARAPKSASPAGRATSSGAVRSREAVKLWFARYRVFSTGSVGVGEGVGAGEADADGEGVGAGWSDWPDCPDSGSSSPPPSCGGASVGCPPRGMSSGSTASVAPVRPAMARTASRSRAPWEADSLVHGTSALTREAATVSPESQTMIALSEPVAPPDEAVAVSTRGPQPLAVPRGREEVGTRTSKTALAPAAIPPSPVVETSEEPASSDRALVRAATETGVVVPTVMVRATSLRGELVVFVTVPAMRSSSSEVMIRGLREDTATVRPDEADWEPRTEGRSSRAPTAWATAPAVRAASVPIGAGCAADAPDRGARAHSAAAAAAAARKNPRVTVPIRRPCTAGRGRWPRSCARWGRPVGAPRRAGAPRPRPPPRGPGPRPRRSRPRRSP